MIIIITIIIIIRLIKYTDSSGKAGLLPDNHSDCFEDFNTLNFALTPQKNWSGFMVHCCKFLVFFVFCLFLFYFVDGYISANQVSVDDTLSQFFMIMHIHIQIYMHIYSLTYTYTYTYTYTPTHLHT